MSQPVQYMVRDGQGHEYGPADIPALRQWVLERRILAAMQIAPVGTQEWTVAGAHPDLADLFRSLSQAATAGAAATPANPYGQATGAATQPYNSGSVQYLRPRRTNGLAIASLVCSLAGFAVCFVPSLLAVVFGHMARSQIRNAPEEYEGDGMALAGLIIGYVCLGLIALVVLFYMGIFVVAMVAAAKGR